MNFNEKKNLWNTYNTHVSSSYDCEFNFRMSDYCIKYNNNVYNNKVEMVQDSIALIGSQNRGSLLNYPKTFRNFLKYNFVQLLMYELLSLFQISATYLEMAAKAEEEPSL